MHVYHPCHSNGEPWNGQQPPSCQEGLTGADVDPSFASVCDAINCLRLQLSMPDTQSLTVDTEIHLAIASPGKGNM